MIPATSPQSAESDRASQSSSHAHSLSELVTQSLSERFGLGFSARTTPLRAYALPVPGAEREAPLYYPLEPGTEGQTIEVYAYGRDSYDKPGWRSAPYTRIGTITLTGHTAVIDMKEPQFAQATRDVLTEHQSGY